MYWLDGLFSHYIYSLLHLVWDWEGNENIPWCIGLCGSPILLAYCNRTFFSLFKLYWYSSFMLRFLSLDLTWPHRFYIALIFHICINMYIYLPAILSLIMLCLVHRYWASLFQWGGGGAASSKSVSWWSQVVCQWHCLNRHGSHTSVLHTFKIVFEFILLLARSL